MAMVQLYGDSLPNYDQVCKPLRDLGFDVIPELGADWGGDTNYSNIADIWILVSYVSFVIITIFLLPRPALIATRFCWIMSLNFMLRTLTIAVTRYPRLPFVVDNYHPSNILWGALLVVIGAKTTATDMMFSGHTLGFITTASFVSRYTQYGVFSVLFWIFNVLGILSLLSVREHYTADVLVAIIVAKFVFWSYHLYLDSEYRRFSVPGLELIGRAQFTLPATLTDSMGKRIRIEPDRWHYHATGDQFKEHVIHEDGVYVPTLTVASTITQDAVVYTTPITQIKVPLIRTERFSTTGARYRVYQWLRWLDSE